MLVSLQSQDVWHKNISLTAAHASGKATANSAAADIRQLIAGSIGSSSSSSHCLAIGRLDAVTQMPTPGSAPAVVVSCGGWFTEMRLLPDLGHVKQALHQPWDSFMTGMVKQFSSHIVPEDMTVVDDDNQLSGPAANTSFPAFNIPFAVVFSMLAGSKQVRHVKFPKQADCSTDSLNAALGQLTQLPQLPAVSLDMSFVTGLSPSSLLCLTQLRVLSLHQCKVGPLESLQVRVRLLFAAQSTERTAE